ncbi:MAG TPA: nucleoside triphosphate pyrophosphohydrolase [Chthoniobacterales bacterium]|nr:nucleoside triphosphate pyrophosphohydrolase [Chthoniobacterales bacterium]
MSEINAEIAQLVRLLGIVRELRERCPWDREQTLGDVPKYLIEEAYEVADAIARDDSVAIGDELGDLLAQVFFAGVIAEQQQRPPFSRIVQNAAEKLVRRHPHIYANSKAETAAEVLASWNEIKKRERKAEGLHSALDGVARGLPALMRAQKLGARAQQAGMDWADIHEVLAKVREEMDELEGALAAGDSEAAAHELGDMLLALANAPRFIGYDAEETLHKACDKFIRRFAAVEHIALARGLDLTKMSAAELEALWQEAKRLDQD